MFVRFFAEVNSLGSARTGNYPHPVLLSATPERPTDFPSFPKAYEYRYRYKVIKEPNYFKDGKTCCLEVYERLEEVQGRYKCWTDVWSESDLPINALTMLAYNIPFFREESDADATIGPAREGFAPVGRNEGRTTVEGGSPAPSPVPSTSQQAGSSVAGNGAANANATTTTPRPGPSRLMQQRHSAAATGATLNAMTGAETRGRQVAGPTPGGKRKLPRVAARVEAGSIASAAAATPNGNVEPQEQESPRQCRTRRQRLSSSELLRALHRRGVGDIF